jgi:NADPH:quinone reductase-like Zn-dependent oxidoreductase
MKAIHHPRYGPLGTLALRDIPTPTIKDGEVLVRVRAAALRIGDCFTVRGAPYMMRAYSGLLKPRYGVPGYDLAGQVEAVGSAVKRFQPGDEVFGASVDTCAEYAAAGEDTLAHRPANLSWQEAAAIPTSALAALHGLRDAGKLQAGQTVLINGASGGVGHFGFRSRRPWAPR